MRGGGASERHHAVITATPISSSISEFGRFRKTWRGERSAFILQLKHFAVFCRWETRRFYARAGNNGGFGRRVPAHAE